MDHAKMEVVSFGFKYGLPRTNFYFDVSFLKNPAREKRWSLFCKPNEEMRDFILSQAECQSFLDYVVPLLHMLSKIDDNMRVGIGCSSGRHRSYVVAEEVARRLSDEGIHVNVRHLDSAE